MGIFRTEFQPKHGTAERWHTCDCEECMTALHGPSCTAPLPAVNSGQLSEMVHVFKEQARDWLTRNAIVPWIHNDGTECRCRGACKELP